MCTIASATLSYAGNTAHWVAVSSAVAAAVTSWMSHDELSKRIERYSSAVRAINDLIWWWKSLDDAERANTAHITKLIETGESILATERLAWIAAARKPTRGDRDGDDGGEGGEVGMEGGSGGAPGNDHREVRAAGSRSKASVAPAI